MRRDSERGSAMLVTMIIVSALFAGAAVLVSMQMATNKTSDVERNGLAALYCAEAGLTASHVTIANNYSNWNGSLCTKGTACGSADQPTWATSAAFSHDLDADGVDDFYIYIKDNDDETGTNNAGSDTDYQIFIVSTCMKYPDYPKQVEELIKYTPTPTCYQSQDGGCNGRGNNN